MSSDRVLIDNCYDELGGRQTKKQYADPWRVKEEED